METQKIVNLLSDSIMNPQNLQQENSTLLTIKIMDSMVEEMKMIRHLNLK